MVSPAAVSVAFGMLLFVLALAFIGYAWWDTGRVAIVYRDMESGDRDVVYARPSEEGLEFDVRGYESAMVRPKAEFMGKWHGSWRPWSHPCVTINPRTGKVIAASERVAHVAGEEDEWEAGELEDRVVQVAWPQVYWRWIDSDAVKQALEANKSPWQQMTGALVMGMIVMSVAFLGVVWITSGGG